MNPVNNGSLICQNCGTTENVIQWDCDHNIIACVECTCIARGCYAFYQAFLQWHTPLYVEITMNEYFKWECHNDEMVYTAFTFGESDAGTAFKVSSEGEHGMPPHLVFVPSHPKDNYKLFW